jgi:hypothetical protein
MSIMHYGKHDVCRAPKSMLCAKPHVHGKDTPLLFPIVMLVVKIVRF